MARNIQCMQVGTVKEPFVVETVLLSIMPCAHNPKNTTSTFIHKLTNRFLLLRFHCPRDSKVRIVLGEYQRKELFICFRDSISGHLSPRTSSNGRHYGDWDF